MWTPKRILLMFGALTLFGVLFTVYAWFLGGIDGLPPLPKEFVRALTQGTDTEPLPLPGESSADRKLRIAFGPGCPEVRFPIRAEISKKGLAFATDKFTILDDGRVEFRPFSIALFNAKRGTGDLPEINTVRSKVAILTFDRPIKRNAHFNNRRIIGAELRGVITINNNRRTAQANDDITVHIVNGPLYFSEAKKLIWSNGIVKLVDTQPQPDPTKIMAKGLEIHLDKNDSLAGGKASKPNGNDTVSAVQKIVLRSNVEMHLHIDGDSGFLSPGPAKKPVQPKQTLVKAEAAKSKSLVHIITQGSFTYDLIEEIAVFESPPARRGRMVNPEADQVKVTRVHKEGKAKYHDQLLCDYLELEFVRKKSDVAPLAGNARTTDRKIARARATATADHLVDLTLDAENLEAHGVEMIYHSPTKDRGAVTIIRGQAKSPLWAVRDLHKITCLELKLQAAGAGGLSQQVYAKGPGQIDLIDPNAKVKVHQYHAVWQEQMTVTKDKERGRELDLLTFVGSAAFIDDAGKKELRADKLMVWLEPAERTRSAEQLRMDKHNKSDNAPRQQPRKLEGIGNVRILSPKLRVKKCKHLIVHFKKAKVDSLPDYAVAKSKNTMAGNPGHTVQKSSGSATPPAKFATVPKDSKNGAAVKTAKRLDGGNERDTVVPKGNIATATKKEKPIDLEARQVAVIMRRSHKKNEFQEVAAEGAVRVRQEGATPADKGVDIVGAAVNLEHDPLGDLLIVVGRKGKPARLQLGKLILMGPKVTIDQKDNTVSIDGIGVMSMPSNTTFEGGKPAQPGTRLTIHWTKDMFFSGKDATFQGGVFAYQNDSRLRCQSMHVSLDRKVSLRKGEKKGKAAKVERIVCSNNVDIEEIKKDAGGRVIRYYRLVATELTADNRNGPVNAAGPGRVYLWQLGSMDIKNNRNNKKSKQFFLTRVDFTGRLYSTKKGESGRIAKFYDNVEVFHLPAAKPSVTIDPNKLPKDSLNLTCQQLVLTSNKAAGGQDAQEMTARNAVKFRTDEFYGSAQEMMYNQLSETIVFRGGVGSFARLYRLRGRGKRPELLTGRRILYNRSNGRFDIGGGQEIRGGGG